jgi:surfeit locus 1 family protein
VSSRASGTVATAAVLIVAAVCIRLGFWQLERLEQRRAQNAAIAAAARLGPLSLDEAAQNEIAARPADFVHRPATASGAYLHDRELLLRGRAHDGRPGVHLVTPLALEGSGRIILVNRGWVPAADAASVDPRPYRQPGLVRVEGLLQAVPEDPLGALPIPVEIADTTVTSYRRLDRSTVAHALEQPIAPLYLQVAPGAGLPRAPPIPVRPPPLDDGPHLGYALQWFGFAAIALIGFSIVVLRGRTGRAGAVGGVRISPPRP